MPGDESAWDSAAQLNGKRHEVAGFVGHVSLIQFGARIEVFEADVPRGWATVVRELIGKIEDEALHAVEPMIQMMRHEASEPAHALVNGSCSSESALTS